MTGSLGVIRRWELWVALVGAALSVFGVVWLTSVLPGLKKIPIDWKQTVDFQGAYTVVGEQKLLQQLLTNPSIQQLLASPSSLALLADPAAQRLLTGNELRAVLADPALAQQVLTNLPALQQASSPAIGQALANPTIRGLLADPTALERLRSPLLQRVLADPVAARQSSDPAVQQLLASPLIRQLLADPVALRALADPGVQGLLANPSLLRLLSNTAVLALLTNPGVPKLLSDATIVKLLADPAALALIGDARVQQVLARPPKLPVVTFPVNFHRVRKAERLEGDTLFLHQDFEATVLGTGQRLDQFSTTATLAVDRKTREYAPGGTEPRQGGFAFPFATQRTQEYAIWVHEVYQPISLAYAGAERSDGVDVYVFQGKATDLRLPPEPKRSLGIPEALDILAEVNLLTKLEPTTGITVDVVSRVIYKLNSVALGNPVVFDGNIRYSPQSIATSLGDARDGRRLLFWAGSVLPWSAISLGLLLLAIVIVRSSPALGPRRPRAAPPSAP